MRKNRRLKKITSRWARIAPSLKLNTDVSKSLLAEEALNRNALSENVCAAFSQGECRRKHWGNRLPRRSHLYLSDSHFLPKILPNVEECTHI